MTKGKKQKTVSGDTARKIWLAGIGAYGRAFSEAQEQLTKVTKGGGKVFDDLVEKGEVIETMVSYKSKEMTKDVMDKVGGGFEVDERIAKMRNRLKRASDGDVDGLSDQLDRVEAKLDQMLKLLKPSPRKKTAPKKKPTTKAKK